VKASRSQAPDGYAGPQTVVFAVRAAIPEALYRPHDGTLGRFLRTEERGKSSACQFDRGGIHSRSWLHGRLPVFVKRVARAGKQGGEGAAPATKGERCRDVPAPKAG